MVSTKGIRCGVAEYTDLLIQSLTKQQLVSDIVWLSHGEVKKSLEYSDCDTILHIQYVPGLYHEIVLKDVLKEFKGKKVITAHHYGGLDDCLEYVDKVIVHDRRFADHSKNVYMVQGCPVYENEMDKLVLREELGLPKYSKIIISYGFIMDWKRLDHMFKAFAPYLVLNPAITMVLLHSIHDFAVHVGHRVINSFQSTINKHNIENSVVLNNDFLSKDVVHKYLRASDLGILFSPVDIDSNGSSAVMKEFISTRCPVVATDIKHYGDMEMGVIKVPMGRIQNFIYKTLSTLVDEDLLCSLEMTLNDLYSVLNYDKFAEKHVEIYKIL